MGEHISPVLGLLFHAVNFAILASLAVLLYRKQGAAAIAETISAAQREARSAQDAHDQARRAHDEAQAGRAGLKGRTDDLRRTAQEESEREAKNVLDNARLGAEAIVREARNVATYTVESGLDAVVREVAGRVVEQTEAKVRGKLTPAVHAALEARFAKDLGNRPDLKWTS
ncbi:MAG: hypothetical protein HYY13_12595 [Nitrospirae bacterium]|nr:hypothetical protein [Nitrospirota bacterium]